MIEKAKKEAAFVVVYMHAGAEGPDADHVTGQEEVYLGEDRGNAEAFAHMAIDAGASLVIASGPHVVRGMQFYKGHLVCLQPGRLRQLRRLLDRRRPGRERDPPRDVVVDGSVRAAPASSRSSSSAAGSRCRVEMAWFCQPTVDRRLRLKCRPHLPVGCHHPAMRGPNRPDGLRPLSWRAPRARPCPPRSPGRARRCQAQRRSRRSRRR